MSIPLLNSEGSKELPSDEIFQSQTNPKKNTASQLLIGKGDKKGGCKEVTISALKWTAVALAIIGVVAGVVGLLVYLGQLQLGLTGVGAMSAATGLYVMLAGFGVTFINGILLGVAKILNRDKGATQQGEKKPLCPSLCSDKGKKKSK